MLPVHGIIGVRFGCAGFVGSGVVGGFCDPFPPGEAQKSANDLTARYGDPIDNLRGLHATPCRATFTGAED
jgi:hypothetical protein